MALTGLAIAAALSLAKDQLVDKPADKKRRELAAKTEELSPWTGRQAADPTDSNTLSTVMQGAATGAQMGQAYQNSQAQNNFLNRQGNLGAPMDVKDANLSQSNQFMAGANPYSGAEAKLDPNAGVPGAGYSQASASSPLAGQQTPAWFYGKGPSDMAQKMAFQKDPYQSLYDANVDPNPPSHYWKVNPYAGN